MFIKTSKKITKKLLNEKIISADDKELYSYGIRNGLIMILNIYLYNPDGTKTVIGIHVRKAPNSYEYNEATRITSNILNFIFNNSNL